MKILALSNFYPPDFLGGYELICSQVVDALRARGHELCVLTAAPRRPVPSVPHVRRVFQLSEVFDGLWLPKLALVTHRLNEVQSNLVNGHNVHVLLGALETFRPDVVLVYNLVGLGGLGLLACLQHLQVPWVWHLEDAIPRHLCSLSIAQTYDPSNPMGKAVPAIVREVSRQLRGHFLACSQRVVQEIESCGLDLGGRVEVISNWVHGDKPRPRTSYYQGGHLRIVSAGWIGMHKGTDLLIESAARLRDRGYTDFSVDLYGKDTNPYFRALIDRFELRPWVTLKGTRTQAELASLFEGYDVFAFPTWAREPFGVAPLEAAATGCVPVLSQCCGISEWLMHGVHCLKAERTVEAFTRVFADILDRAIDLEPLGRRASAVIWRDFHLDAILPRIEGALARAAAQPRAEAGSAAEAYQLALLAERCTQALVHETQAA